MSTCITRGTEKGGLGVAHRYAKTPHGRALFKDPDTGRRKQNPDRLHKERKKDTGGNERQGANAQQSFKANKVTAG